MVFVACHFLVAHDGKTLGVEHFVLYNGALPKFDELLAIQLKFFDEVFEELSLSDPQVPHIVPFLACDFMKLACELPQNFFHVYESAPHCHLVRVTGAHLVPEVLGKVHVEVD
jgi:hypothetical protein